MASISRIILAILGVTSVGLALAAALVFGSLDRLSLRTTEANVDFLLTQLRNTIEANVGLGLPLADIRVVQDLIERAKLTDDQVLAVEVFSPDGISLFNTDRGSIGEAIPPVWRDSVRYRIANERWRVEELGNIVVGAVIRNDFAEPVGYLALTVSGAARDQHARMVLTGLLRDAAFAAPIALLAVALLALLTLRWFGRGLQGLARRIAGEPSAAGDGSLPAAFAEGADRVRAATDRAAADFERAATQVLEIDELESRHAA
jgi:hypothetical protein